MAYLFPFKGHRYDKRVVGDLNLVVTQPYDKIPTELQQEYYRRSPFNVVRITRNSEKNNDPNTEYPDARSTFERWLQEAVLVRDPLPAIYAYYQEYTIEREVKLLRGFIALLDLKHSEGGILPH